MILETPRCVTTSQVQKVKGQGHTKPKLDLEAWRRHHSGPLCIQ